jgi:hypothetical protein
MLAFKAAKTIPGILAIKPLGHANFSHYLLRNSGSSMPH